MAELKTQKNMTSVKEFLASITDPVKRSDAQLVLRMMKDITHKRATMWGDSIVGFGEYHYKYKSGREGDWFVTGFSPRKTSLTIYIMPGFSHYSDLLKKLGKHKTSVSCLYIKKLEDVELDVLKQIISQSVKDMADLYTFK